MTIHVRRATAADAPELSQLGAATFRETFEAENTPEDMAGYLAEAFTPERQKAEILDPANVVLVAAEGRGLVGYAQLASGPAPPAVGAPSPIELKRFYVTRAWHGRGVAQALMTSVLQAARARQAETLWLGVWERNPRAIAFYRKYGFERVGEHTFMLGNDAQTDWVLARPL
jgi:ribosomal protein S18 acetylase RimI-like enzyme